jgi:hypothetical protein
MRRHFSRAALRADEAPMLGDDQGWYLVGQPKRVKFNPRLTMIASGAPSPAGRTIWFELSFRRSHMTVLRNQRFQFTAHPKTSKGILRGGFKESVHDPSAAKCDCHKR